MSSFEILECAVSGRITGGGEFIGNVVGDPACAKTVECDGGMEIQ